MSIIKFPWSLTFHPLPGTNQFIFTFPLVYLSTLRAYASLKPNGHLIESICFHFHPILSKIVSGPRISSSSEAQISPDQGHSYFSVYFFRSASLLLSWTLVAAGTYNLSYQQKDRNPSIFLLALVTRSNCEGMYVSYLAIPSSWKNLCFLYFHSYIYTHLCIVRYVCTLYAYPDQDNLIDPCLIN